MRQLANALGHEKILYSLDTRRRLFVDIAKNLSAMVALELSTYAE